MSDIPRLLTAADLVAMGIFSSPQAASQARYKGIGPTFLRLGNGRGGRVRYRETDVLDWLESCERTTAEG